ICPGVAPMACPPVRTSLAVAACRGPPLLAAVSVAVTRPAWDGANRTVIRHARPGRRRAARQVSRVMLKAAGPDSRTRSLPVAFRPELVKVNVFTADCPGLTGPKSYGDGLNTSTGPVGRAAAAAVPAPGSTAAPASASVPATATAVRRHAVNALRHLPDPPQYDTPSPPAHRWFALHPAVSYESARRHFCP